MTSTRHTDPAHYPRKVFRLQGTSAAPSSPASAPVKHSRSGFTLIELLVATMLLSIVMTAVYTLTNGVITAWRTTEQDYDAYQNARNFITLVQREFSAAVAGHLFEGEEDEFTLFTVSEPFDIEKSTGRHLIRVRYRLNNAKDELIREEALVVSALPTMAPPDGKLPVNRIRVKHEEKFVVATGVKKMDVRYEWVPRMLDRDITFPPEPMDHIVVNMHSIKFRLGMPQAILIKLTLADPDAKQKGKTLTVESRIVMRGKPRGYPLYMLQEHLREAL